MSTILQGGFKAILETLPRAGTEVQLSLISTVQQLLGNEDCKYKVEFKRLDGYSLLSSIFNKKRDYFDRDNEKFLTSLFEIHSAIITSGDTR